MSLDRYIKPWKGKAFRHIPASPENDVFDFDHIYRQKTNRWNMEGEPTLYLAKDQKVLIGEWGRNFNLNRNQSLKNKVLKCCIYRFSIRLNFILDLRAKKVCQMLNLKNTPHCFLETSVARATAHFLRYTTKTQGLLVPFMAFLDNPDLWCLVIFLEKLQPDFRKYLTNAEK